LTLILTSFVFRPHKLVRVVRRSRITGLRLYKEIQKKILCVKREEKILKKSDVLDCDSSELCGIICKDGEGEDEKGRNVNRR
jgi:hypothetical protein